MRFVSLVDLHVHCKFSISKANFSKMIKIIRIIANCSMLIIAPTALAQNADETIPTRIELWSSGFQATHIWQGYPAFKARTTGDGSLSAKGQIRETTTATAHLGLRLLENTELWLNPEAAQGFGVNHSRGLAGFPNGDASKAGSVWPREYIARAFIRQTINLDSDREWVDGDANILAGYYSPIRLVITAGKFAIGDIFSDNKYSHDPRSQFLNWSIMEAGAWDFASDARQYTSGIAHELIFPGRAMRFGSFLMPDYYNPPELAWRGAGSLHHVAELEQEYSILDLPGALRVLGFYSRAHMARFKDILATAPTSDEAFASMRRYHTPKIGAALTIEQKLTPDIGFFARGSWDDGKTEDLSFTQIDRSIALGLNISGLSWGRASDVLGVAFSENRLSHAHSAVVRSGAAGLMLTENSGMRYAAERIAEIYYSLSPWPNGPALTLDYQVIGNPAYNHDRGPVHLFAFRMRFAFGMRG